MAVTVTPTVEPAYEPPRVKLEVVADSATTEVTVLRLDPDGSTSPVRTDDGNPLQLTLSGSDRVGEVYDYEPPYQEAIAYYAEEDPATVSGEITVDVDVPWLVHLGIPTLSRSVTLASFGGRTRPVRRAIYRPMGSRFAVAHTDGRRKAAESAIELRIDTLAELYALEDLTDDASVLLLNVPASLGWGVRHEYVSVGDIEEVRLIEYAAEPRRYYQMPYVVVARPEGGTRAAWSMDDIAANFATMNDIKAAFPTMADIAAGV